MYKSRILIWLGIILTLVSGKIIYNIALHWDENHPIYYFYNDVSDVQTNAKINCFDNCKTFDITSYSAKADVIIKDQSDDTIEGYKKYEKALYTPLVMFSYEANKVSTGFTYVNATNGIAAYKELLTVLNAIENNKTYEDIGLSTYLTGNVKLAIPNKTSQTYSLVEELFYVTFNDGKVPNESEREELKDRVDEILNKCIQLENVKTKLVLLDSQGEITVKKPHDTLYLATENIAINDSNNAFILNVNSNDYSGWYPVYFNATVAQYYDLYIREDNADEFYNAFLNSNFTSLTGIRVKNGSDNFYSETYNIMRNVNIVN